MATTSRRLRPDEMSLSASKCGPPRVPNHCRAPHDEPLFMIAPLPREPAGECSAAGAFIRSESRSADDISDENAVRSCRKPALSKMRSRVRCWRGDRFGYHQILPAIRR